MLPQLQKVSLPISHFPTAWQAVIFRNYNKVSTEVLAKVLKTSADVIKKEAERMGLKANETGKIWQKYGYLSLIRSNWHLLSYEQICTLLDIDEKKLSEILYEDDFMFVKMGDFKPDVSCEYSPLNEEQIKRTEQILKVVKKYGQTDVVEEPFSFMQKIGSQKMRNDHLKINLSCKDERAKGYIDYCKGYYDYSAVKEAEIELLQQGEEEKEDYELSFKKGKAKIKADSAEGVLRALQELAQMSRFGEEKSVKRKFSVRTRILYSYFAPCGDVLIGDELPYGENLLRALADLQINGVWLHAILNKMTPFPFDETVSEGWQTRIKNLQRQIDLAAKYGIKVYLYLNEPRAMPKDFFKKYPELAGTTEGDLTALCIGTEQVRNYLREGVKKLISSLDGLGGIFTITMSENLTNCHSRTHTSKMNCARCAETSPADSAVTVNNLIRQGINDSGKNCRLIAWTWGWSDYLGWTREMIDDAVGRLADGIDVMCVSEDQMEIEKYGIRSQVIDYSISNVGPSKKTQATIRRAKSCGHDIFAKVQISNSWEMSSVPYLPVFPLVGEHMQNLRRFRVDGLMLSWTLGGCPGMNLKYAQNFYTTEEKDEQEWYRKTFGKNAEKVKQASEIASEAFKNFPFDVEVLYKAPQNYGAANLLYLQETGFKATMVGFCYDDIDSWRGVFPREVFCEAFRVLADGLKKAMNALEISEKDANTEDVYRCLSVWYATCSSVYVQTRLVLLRGSDGKESERRELLETEKNNTLLTLKAVMHDSRIGFEASNHYMYDKNLLLEKLVQLEFYEDMMF